MGPQSLQLVGVIDAWELPSIADALGLIGSPPWLDPLSPLLLLLVVVGCGELTALS